MKKISYVIGLIVIALAMCGVMNAQTVPTPTVGGSGGGESGGGGGGAPVQVPLMSVRTLKAYALANVSELHGQVWGHSVSGDQNWFSVQYPFRDADPAHMAALVGTQTVRFTADPTETLQSYVGYRSSIIISNWSFEMFYGGARFNLVLGPASWQVPAHAYQIRLELSHWIPLKVPGIIGAYIITENAQGYQTGYYDFRSDGRINEEYEFIALSPVHVNQNGKLYIMLRDGSKIVYNLREEGNLQPLVSLVIDGFRPSIVGVRNVPTGTSTIVFEDGDELVRASYNSPTRVSVTFPPGRSKYPIAIYSVNAKAFAENPFIDWREHNIFQSVFIDAGNGGLLIRFEYEEPAPALPESGGEKG